MDHAKIVERVRKLLAMAADTSSPEEAAIAARRAASLMEKHAIEQSDVLMSDRASDGLGEQTASDGYKAVPSWYAYLIVPVARLFDCKAKYHNVRGRIVPEFQGIKEDAIVAAYTLDYLAGQINLLSEQYRKQHPEAGRSGMNDYRQGASLAIQRMLAEETEAKAQRAATQPGTSLVVRKQELVEAKYGVAKYKKSSQRTRASAHSANGYRDGKSVGLRSSVGQSTQGRLGA